MTGKYKPLMNHRAVCGQQVGDTAAALGLGLLGREGRPDEAEAFIILD
jgi:hypothetical protein